MPVIGWGLASRALKPTTPMSLRFLKRKKLQQLIIITINLLPSVCECEVLEIVLQQQRVSGEWAAYNKL